MATIRRLTHEENPQSYRISLWSQIVERNVWYTHWRRSRSQVKSSASRLYFYFLDKKKQHVLQRHVSYLMYNIYIYADLNTTGLVFIFTRRKYHFRVSVTRLTIVVIKYNVTRCHLSKWFFTIGYSLNCSTLIIWSHVLQSLFDKRLPTSTISYFPGRSDEYGPSSIVYFSENITTRTFHTTL